MDNTSMVDILTVVIAFIAAIASIYSVIVNKSANEKTDLLNNYTAERLKDINTLKKCAKILLSEASKITSLSEDCLSSKNESISKIVEASNEYWFRLKPVYVRDEETLKSLIELKSELISFYMLKSEQERKKHITLIINKSINFRKMTFLYVHSSWTCIKHQILYGERSEYNEFNEVYTHLEMELNELMNNKENVGFKDLWNL